MTLQDGRFRTDGKTIEACCEKLKRILELNEPYFRMNNGVRPCPFCGAKLEYVDKLDVS